MLCYTKAVYRNIVYTQTHTKHKTNIYIHIYNTVYRHTYTIYIYAIPALVSAVEEVVQSGQVLHAYIALYIGRERRRGQNYDKFRYVHVYVIYISNTLYTSIVYISLTYTILIALEYSI